VQYSTVASIVGSHGATAPLSARGGAVDGASHSHADDRIYDEYIESDSIDPAASSERMNDRDTVENEEQVRGRAGNNPSLYRRRTGRSMHSSMFTAPAASVSCLDPALDRSRIEWLASTGGPTCFHSPTGCRCIDTKALRAANSVVNRWHMIVTAASFSNEPLNASDPSSCPMTMMQLSSIDYNTDMLGNSTVSGPCGETSGGQHQDMRTCGDG